MGMRLPKKDKDLANAWCEFLGISDVFQTRSERHLPSTIGGRLLGAVARGGDEETGKERAER